LRRSNLTSNLTFVAVGINDDVPRICWRARRWKNSITDLQSSDVLIFSGRNAWNDVSHFRNWLGRDSADALAKRGAMNLVGDRKKARQRRAAPCSFRKNQR